MFRTSHGETAALYLPWPCLGELDQVLVLHHRAEHRDPVDSYHPRSHRSGERLRANMQSALADIMVPYRLLLGISGQLVGAFLVECPGTGRFSNWEWMTDAFRC